MNHTSLDRPTQIGRPLDQLDSYRNCSAPPYLSDPECGDVCATCCDGRVGDADGWAARHFKQLKLAESQEMQEDRAYLEATALKLQSEGLKVSAPLALGDPPTEILRTAEREQHDLIAMTSHGHRFIADMFYGSTISKVRHKSPVPVLVVKAEAK